MRRQKNSRRTKLREDNEIFGVALWTQHLSGTVTTLLLIDPSLQTGLMDPTIRSATPARPYPQCIAVVFLRRKANPARPESDGHRHLCQANSLHLANNQPYCSQNLCVLMLHSKSLFPPFIVPHILPLCRYWSSHCMGHSYLHGLSNNNWVGECKSSAA